MTKLRVVPPTATLRVVAFLDGKKGWAQQCFRNDEYGVNMTGTRESYDSHWVSTYTVDGLDGVFTSFKAMNDAIREVLAAQEGKQ